jgi:hypothetical protein
MHKKIAIVLLMIFFICIGMTAFTEEKSSRIVSERPIAHINVSSWIVGSFKVSPDNKQVACGAHVGNKFFVIVNEKDGKQYDGIGNLIFSPDSKQVTYAAQVGNKLFVVIDGKEGKQYDGILAGTPLFSPDSKQVAYGAQVGNKWFVVVDGKEGKQYDDIITKGGGSIIFDSANSFHYLVRIGEDIFLVEERIE